MMKKMLVVASVGLAVSLTGCGKKDSGGGKKKHNSSNGPSANSLMLDFVSEAANALPQVKTSGARNLFSNTNISQDGELSLFFKQECYMPNDAGTSYEGFCPADVRAELDTAMDAGGIGEGSDVFSKYKLSATTLIGLVYHAEMYSQGPGLSNDCDSLNANSLATNHSPVFTGGTDPDKFVIDYSQMLSCVKTNNWGGNTTYATFGYNDNADNPAIANLTARWGLPYGDQPDAQSDIFQVYLAFDKDTVDADSPTPTFLGFNFVSAGGSRAVILSDLTSHKFAARYFSRVSDSDAKQIVAVGTAGVDKTTGTAVTGHYSVADLSGTPEHQCVDNTTGNYEADSSLCAVDLTTMTGDTIETFLDMSSEDSTNLSGFLEFFANDDVMDTTKAPGTDYTDDKTNYFPKTIR